MTDTKLYRHFAKNGVLLYVGVAAVGYRRQAIHLGNSPWGDKITKITLETFASRDNALEAERAAIARENPLYNTRKDSHSAYGNKRSPIAVRLPDPLIQHVDRVAFENNTSRTQALILLLEEAISMRDS